MLGFHMGKMPALKTGIVHDTEYWLQQINRASVVANVKAGLLDREAARRLHKALDEIREEASRGLRSKFNLYIQFEPELLKRCGRDAGILHAGRSSQDILATCNAALNRERLVLLADAVVRLCKSLVETVRREGDAVVPAYTNGVQAQPTLYGHYLLAHINAFSRDAERMIECWRRHDVCPMGSCVCTGTGWSLDTEEMAGLLGFSKPVDQSFDAGQIRGNDLPLEMSQIVTSVMLHVNAFLADFMVQYAQTKPWVVSMDLNGVYHSSSMPQKRNPGLINDCRRDAGLVIGEAQGVMMRMQNLTLGMADVRDEFAMGALAEDAATVIETFAGIVRSLHVDRERARDELMSEWTCTQEIADVLMRTANIDFRTGHGFASRFVTIARTNGWTPKTVKPADLHEVWKSYAEEHGLSLVFPLSDDLLKTVIEPEHILAGRRTPGSASPIMLEAQTKQAELHLAGLSGWLDFKQNEATQAAGSLEAKLAKI